MKFKKVMALALVGVMAASMAACGSSDSSAPAATTESKTETTAAESSAETTTDGAEAEATGDLTALGDKLVVWTLANDLIDFGNRFQEQTGVEVETVVIEPANYPTKVQTALMAGEKEPDIIVGEPQMLQDFWMISEHRTMQTRS